MSAEFAAEIASDLLEARRRRENAMSHTGDPRDPGATERRDGIVAPALGCPREPITRSRQAVTVDQEIELIGHRAVEIWAQMQLDVWIRSFSKNAEAMLLNYIQEREILKKEMELAEAPVLVDQ